MNLPDGDSVPTVSFTCRPAKRGTSRVEVVACAPALLISVDANGQVDVHVAAERYDDAIELLDMLEARPDIGSAVRLLVERGTEGASA